MNYHWRDGWHFERTDDGSVKISHDEKILEIIIPPHEWASIVASVSVHGESGDNFSAARKLHGD